MESKQAHESIAHIREMMSKSSKFKSLSGAAGITAGLLTLVLATVFCLQYEINPFAVELSNFNLLPSEHYLTALVYALTLLFCSIIAGIVLTKLNAVKNQEPLWGPASRNFIYNMVLPMVFSILFCLILFQKNPDYVLPVSLILYGLTLFNAGKYAHKAIRSLGITEMLLGAICLQFLQFHILIWIIGFGVMHIVFGMYMIIKPDRN